MSHPQKLSFDVYWVGINNMTINVCIAEIGGAHRKLYLMNSYFQNPNLGECEK